MKIHFKTKLEAIDWIAAYAEHEGQFEVLREQLLFNFIHFDQYFLQMKNRIEEVVLLNSDENQ